MAKIYGIQASSGMLQMPDKQALEMRSEGELSCSEEESQSHTTPMDAGAAAVGGIPGHVSPLIYLILL